METISAKQNLISLLQTVQGFSTLNEEILKQMAGAAEYHIVARGEMLIKEGELVDNLYIVLKGRFIVFSGKTPIAEISTAEPIGELAFFAGGKRTASVVAARNSCIMSLSRKAYESLSRQTPELSNGILAALSQRLSRTISICPELRPKAGNVCSVFPGLDLRLDPAFTEGVKHAFDKHDGWTVLEDTDCPADLMEDMEGMNAWIEEQESTKGNLVLLCIDPEKNAVWCYVAANNSDTVFIAIPKCGIPTGSASPSKLERDLMAETLKSNIQLALFRPSGSDPTTGTAHWLDQRDVALHHHVALDIPQDFDRLGRFMRGEAVGLVLCGGGSYGTAHLGVLKALLERGHLFDFVGGTSVGSAMAAALAIGYDPAMVMDLCEDIFIRSKALSRLTVPRCSVLDHGRLDGALKNHFGKFDVEDVPINFFSVATSLTFNDVRILRRGPLWQSVRASTAIPGLLPPFITDDGEVLIDGGLLDNVPVTIMRDLKPGRNVVLNFHAISPWRSRARYEDLPTRWQALCSLILKRKKTVRHPSVFGILSRSMVVSSRKLLEQTEIGPDVLLNISPLKGMSYMNWTRGRELFDAAYTQMADALDRLPSHPDEVTDKNRLDRLHKAAETINAVSADFSQKGMPFKPPALQCTPAASSI
jgi:NTE family protein